LATPGLRIKAALTPALSFAIAAFNGDPANPGPGNAQQRDAGGTNFRLDSDRFLIGEWSYSNNLGPDREGLPGTFKFGAWYHSGRFPDQRDDTTGLSLANPASTGIAASHRGDFGAYLIADQTVWREPGTSDQGLGAFFRIAGAPPDRNLIAFHVDAGISYKGLLPRRDNDTIGLALSLARIGSAQRALARDAETFTGTSRPIPDFEAVIEASYQAALTPWWIVQPDVQLVLHPGARLGAAATPSPKPIPNAFVLGLRTAVIF
jgi:porin